MLPPESDQTAQIMPGYERDAFPIKRALPGVYDATIFRLSARIAHPALKAGGEFRREGFTGFNLDGHQLLSILVNYVHFGADVIAPEVNAGVRARRITCLEKLRYDEALEKPASVRVAVLCVKPQPRAEYPPLVMIVLIIFTFCQ